MNRDTRPATDGRRLKTESDPHRSFLPKMKHLFEAIDRSYDQAAARYGFNCQGCDENCCRTKFYHHTHLEYLYLREGFKSLPPEDRRTAIHRATAVRDAHAIADRKGIVAREMCPVNMKGLCRLYDHRPMICRLHGLPHEINRPGCPPRYHQGCSVFDEGCGDKDYVVLDRTPLYMKMAELEKTFKNETGIQAKIRLTIAEMITTFEC